MSKDRVEAWKTASSAATAVAGGVDTLFAEIAKLEREKAVGLLPELFDGMSKKVPMVRQAV